MLAVASAGSGPAWCWTLPPPLKSGHVQGVPIQTLQNRPNSSTPSPESRPFLGTYPMSSSALSALRILHGILGWKVL